MPFGLTEIVIIIFVVLLLFGGKRIPGLAKSIAESIRSFKTGINEVNRNGDNSNDKMAE